MSLASGYSFLALGLAIALSSLRWARRFKEGDVVKKDQVIATIAPDELRADRAYFAENAQGLSSRLVTPDELFHPGARESFKI